MENKILALKRKLISDPNKLSFIQDCQENREIISSREVTGKLSFCMTL
jgi:hypothetical protein